MRVKNKNIILAVIQAISMLLLLIPITYIKEGWSDINGRGTQYKQVLEEGATFFDKLLKLENGQFVGIAFLAVMAVLMVVLIVQIIKKDHFGFVPVIALISGALLCFYSFVYLTEAWSTLTGPAFYYEYSANIGVYLILALQITIALIGFMSNVRVNQCGILEEEPTPMRVTEVVNSADEIAKFKDLYDRGAITKEEFEAKKKQLLEL